MRRCFLFPLLAVCAWINFTAPAKATQPNIVFILVDDLGKHDLGCEGSTFYETPNIDRLANQSMRFVNGYSACQVCSSSRAAIQTGKYPMRTGITTWIHAGGSNQPENWKRNTRLLPAKYSPELALEEQTIAERLKSLGYATFFAGKWHLGGDGHTPLEQGYDVNVGGFEFGSPPGGFFAPYNNQKLKDGQPGEQLPLRLAAETAKYIRESSTAEQPYFAMLSFYSVHAPLETTETLWNKYQVKAEQLGLVQNHHRFVWDRVQEVRQVQDHPVYAGMMQSLDESVGIVLEAIRNSGEADNTIVIFTSDNGGVSSGDGYATSCLPLRGGKGRQWEGGVREPYYICWPGKTDGRPSEVFASGIDFLPTLNELAGGDPVDGLDGVSLVPALQGRAMPARKLYWHYPHYSNQGGEPSAMVRDENWKLIYYYEDGHRELYNLESDIGEQHDVFADHPVQAAELAKSLDQWLSAIAATKPSINPDFDAQKYASQLERSQTVGLENREREHARFLEPNFKPNGGWWQDRKRQASR